MKRILVLLAGLGIGLLPGDAWCQPMAAPAGINAALTRLFGEHTNFIAQAEVRVLNPQQVEQLSAVMEFALSGDRVRTEMDLTQLRHKYLPTNAANALPQVGLDRTIMIFDANQSTALLVFPGLRACVDLPLPKDEIARFTKSPSPRMTPLGVETLDGRLCRKSRVVITDDEGQAHEATIWQAADLKNFPVQIQTRERDDTVILRFRRVQFVKPAAGQFEPPAGYQRFDSATALLQGVMMKNLRDLVAPGATP